MDEAGSSGSAEFEDFDDDELWRAEDALMGSLIYLIFLGYSWELGYFSMLLNSKQGGHVFFCSCSTLKS